MDNKGQTVSRSRFCRTVPTFKELQYCRATAVELLCSRVYKRRPSVYSGAAPASRAVGEVRLPARPPGRPTEGIFFPNICASIHPECASYPLVFSSCRYGAGWLGMLSQIFIIAKDIMVVINKHGTTGNDQTRRGENSPRSRTMFACGEKKCGTQINTWRCLLSLLEPQSRFGDKPFKFQLVYPQNGTAVLKGLRLARGEKNGMYKN